ncbi:MAG TPA: RDD family protein [Rhodopila sp.]|jgi:uncharacterized RDD family membrane protein YckC|nr:RDD family protein [Rhodopila sp.]
MSDTLFETDYDLTEGVLLRRVIAWCIDLVLVGVIAWAAWVVVVLIGLLTFGLGFALLGLLPAIGVLYHTLFVAGAHSATPGMRIMDLTVRREGDLGRPSLMQAIVFTAGLWLTLSFAFFLLFLALFTHGHRTLHDIVAGVVVLRRNALTRRLRSGNMGLGTGYR